MSKRSKYYDSRSINGAMLAKIPQRHPTLHPVVNSRFCGRHCHLKRCSHTRHAVTTERGHRMMCHLKPSTQDVSVQLPSSQFNSQTSISVLQRDIYRYYDESLTPDLCVRDSCFGYDFLGARAGTLEPCMVRSSYGISMDPSAIWRR